MKLGIIVYSNDRETVWNALRIAVFAQEKGDKVNIFFIAKGVEGEVISDEKYPIAAQLKDFKNWGGNIFACQNCLKDRKMEGTELMPASTLGDLYKIMEESDRLITL
ncbi:MAG TPA: DsrE family protein [Acidobacteriota bacterium]|jgi:uncharacterized protein involved in oxidation of intracellular sulfur|nr:DsrE family protein [Acidobacteriota bacterium]HNT16622.1 DsrE family protein [Acidobacteriota bacterium]HPA26675.1 DsrE family protein [Acidobacteriota bacterium]HQO19967.1 DsrE family protein [Acidobacteriota bacterium]HQQ46806.1 DsrE family protein [Acidobacteriota bacterium]